MLCSATPNLCTWRAIAFPARCTRGPLPRQVRLSQKLLHILVPHYVLAEDMFQPGKPSVTVLVVRLQRHDMPELGLVLQEEKQVADVGFREAVAEEDDLIGGLEMVSCYGPRRTRRNVAVSVLSSRP